MTVHGTHGMPPLFKADSATLSLLLALSSRELSSQEPYQRCRALCANHNHGVRATMRSSARTVFARRRNTFAMLLAARLAFGAVTKSKRVTKLAVTKMGRAAA